MVSLEELLKDPFVFLSALFERTQRDLLITRMEAIYLLDHSLTLPVVNELNLKGSNIFRLFLIYCTFHKSASSFLQRRRNMVSQLRYTRSELQNVTDMTLIYIRVKILAGWGKSLGEYENMVWSSFAAYCQFSSTASFSLILILIVDTYNIDIRY